MTSRHKLLGESPSRYPISAQDVHARTRTHTHKNRRSAGRCEGGVGRLRPGGFSWFTGFEPAGSDRLDRVVLSKGAAIEFKDGVRLGAPALECVDVCAKKGDGLAGRRRF